MRDASIVTSGAPPPLWLAAYGPRMMRLAARYCDGWVADFYGPDPTRFRSELEAFHEALNDVKRPHHLVESVVGLHALMANDHNREFVMNRAQRLAPASDDPLEDRFAVGDAGRIAAAIQEYWAAGADHVVLVLSPWHFGRFDADAIKSAEAVVSLAR